MNFSVREIIQNTKVRRVLKVASAVVGVFVLLNVGLLLAFMGRTYPGTQVAGKSIGSVTKGSLPRALQTADLVPDTLQLVYGTATLRVTLSDLGVRLDTDATAKRAMERHWLPVVNLFAASQDEAVFLADATKMDKAVGGFVAANTKPAKDAGIALEGSDFTLVSAVPGIRPHLKESKQSILAALAGGKQVVSLPDERLRPAVTDSQMAGPLKALQEQQKVAVGFTYNGKTANPSKGEVAGWYDQSGNTYVLADAKVKAYVLQVGKNFGIRVKNSNEAAAATLAALESKKPLSFTLEPSPIAKTFTYCVSATGVDASHLSGLKGKLQTTFADPRGWGLEGAVAFTEVTTGCNFTVALTAAALMPTYGAICDSLWSCMVPPNVVINFDRWQGASDSWNAAGGSLDDYRSMVINHETGHWLGFYHANCGGAGQSAPVMQQQSIDLQGCTFNPWPTVGERATLASRLGI